jgi:hypothetical protein
MRASRTPASRLGERAVERLDLRRAVVERGKVRADGALVPAGDRAGQDEPVLDRAQHERHERLWRCPHLVEEAGRGALEGHEVVAGDDRGCVIERPVGVTEGEMPQAQRLRQPGRTPQGSVVLRRERGPRPVELLRTAFA